MELLAIGWTLAGVILGVLATFTVLHGRIPRKCKACGRHAVIKADAASFRCYACMRQWWVTTSGAVGKPMEVESIPLPVSRRTIPGWDVPDGKGRKVKGA